MIGALALAVVLEAFFPRRPEPASASYRWTNNIALSLVNQVNVGWFTAFVTLGISLWGEEAQFGLLHWSGIGFWPSVLCAIVIFELIAYWFHRALHAFPWLWRIHAVHHSDTDIDVTTTYRSHPVELLVIAPLTVPTVLLLGFPPAAFPLYDYLFGTARSKPHSEQATMETGLEYFRGHGDSRVDRLLLMPFVWRPGGETGEAERAGGAASTPLQRRNA